MRFDEMKERLQFDAFHTSSLLKRKVYKHRRLSLVTETFLNISWKNLFLKSAHVFYFAEGKRWCRGKSDENWLREFKMHQGSTWTKAHFPTLSFQMHGVRVEKPHYEISAGKKYRKENSCSIIIMFSSLRKTEKMMLGKSLKKKSLNDERTTVLELR